MSDGLRQKKQKEDVMRMSRWVPIALAVMFVFGLAATAKAEMPEFTIDTAFTDRGSSTWAPSTLFIDQDAARGEKFALIRVNNVSNDDFGFVIDELGVNRLIPALDDLSIPIPIDKPGLYKFYSDMHNIPNADPREWVPDIRPHVGGWLLIGSSSQGDTFYFDTIRAVGNALKSDLSGIRTTSMHPDARYALVESCAVLMGQLTWATKAIWNPDDPKHAAKPASYGKVYSFVENTIKPSMTISMTSVSLPAEARTKMVNMSIKKLHKLQILVAEANPVSRFGVGGQDF